MELAEVAGKCRACQGETSEESQILIYSEKKLKDIFHDVTSIKIDKEDKLPEVLCSKCHSRLLDAHEFRQMCAVSAMKFHRILLQANLAPKHVKRNYVLKNKATRKNFGKKKLKKVEELKEEPSNTPESGSISPGLHPTEYVSVELPEEHTKTLSLKQEQNLDIEDVDSLEDTLSGNLEIDEDPEPDATVSIKNDLDVEPRKQKDKVEQDTGDSDRFIDSIHQCYICKKVFQRKSGLITHLTKIHMNVKVTVCTICGKDCLRSSKLDVHMTEVHGITEGLTCKTCEKTYKHRDSLLMHIRRFHSGKGPVKKPRNFMCEECGKAFPSRCALLKHSYSHSGLRPYACSHCPKRYVTKHKLKEHMMRHAGIKNHVCTICGLRKTTFHELKVHMNYHTREKTHTCQFCNRIYTNISNMNRHVNIVHLGVKPYPCTTCGRAFGKQQTLRHHMMTHTGEKPEVCSVCGKRFIQSVALKKHMQTHGKHK